MCHGSITKGTREKHSKEFSKNKHMQWSTTHYGKPGNIRWSYKVINR